MSTVVEKKAIRGGLYVKRPARRGKTMPQRQGPSPSLDSPHILLDPGQPGEGEFDLSPQGAGWQIGSYVIGLERSIVHAEESVVCCTPRQWSEMETIKAIPYTSIVEEGDPRKLLVHTVAGVFRLQILNVNTVRFTPFEG